MAINENRRLSQEERQTDRTIVLAIRDLHDYAPINQAYTTEALIALEAELTRAEQDELRLQNAINTARDTTTAAAWALHNAVLGAKTQVVAQYGASSSTMQAIGLKKKSERKRPARRDKVGTT